MAPKNQDVEAHDARLMAYNKPMGDITVGLHLPCLDDLEENTVFLFPIIGHQKSDFFMFSLIRLGVQQNQHDCMIVFGSYWCALLILG